MFKDDALLELASTKPKSVADLNRSRLLLREARKGDIADGILNAVQTALATPPDEVPKPDTSRDQLQVNGALADPLRVLLKAKSEETGVASKLIANAAELDEIAAGLRSVPALRGWRAKVFGNDAMKLCSGEVALTAKGRTISLVEL